MEARGIDASDGRLTAAVRGEVETEDKVLVLKRIHVLYTIDAPESARAAVERVHAVHKRYCPVSRSVERAIDITTEYQLGAAPPDA